MWQAGAAADPLHGIISCEVSQHAARWHSRRGSFMATCAPTHQLKQALTSVEGHHPKGRERGHIAAQVDHVEVGELCGLGVGLWVCRLWVERGAGVHLQAMSKWEQAMSTWENSADCGSRSGSWCALAGACDWSWRGSAARGGQLALSSSRRCAERQPEVALNSSRVGLPAQPAATEP